MSARNGVRCSDPIRQKRIKAQNIGRVCGRAQHEIFVLNTMRRTGFHELTVGHFAASAVKFAVWRIWRYGLVRIDKATRDESRAALWSSINDRLRLQAVIKSVLKQTDLLSSH